LRALLLARVALFRGSLLVYLRSQHNKPRR
jgi:hypothetical protein